MRKPFWLLFALAAMPIYGQSNYLTITTTFGIKDSSGTVIQAGTFCAYATDSNDNPIPFVAGDGAQVPKGKVCRNIASGALATSLQLANPAVTNPQNINYHITVTNTPSHQATEYPGVIIQSGGSSWDWSQWNPSTSSIPVNIVTGPPGPQCSIGLGVCTMTVPINGPGATFNGVTVGKSYQLNGGSQVAGTLQTAITNGGAGSTIILPANYAETITSAVTISNSNVTLRCEKGATITAGTAISNMLAVTGSSVTIDGCIFDNNLQAANTTNVLTATGTDRFVFRFNRVLNTPNGAQALLLSSATNSDVSHNYFTNLQGGGISVTGAGHDLIIGNNTLDGTNQPILAPHGGGTIIAVSATTSTGYSNVQVSNNTLTTATDFCIAIGGTTSHPYVNSTVSGNVCYIVNTTGTNSCETAPASRACGGISVNGNSVTNGLAITNNAIYGSGQNIDIGGIELVSCSSCSVTGNNMQLTPGSNSRPVGIYLNGSTNSNITGNLINGWATSTTTAAYPGGIVSVSGDNSTITGNTLIFPPDGGSHIVYGVELNCGGASLTIRNAAISGNNFIGVSAASSTGVFATDALGAACPVTSTVGDNVFSNLSTGIFTAGAADVSLNIGINLFNSVTTQQLASNSSTNATTFYGNITAPSAINFVKQLNIKTDGTSNLNETASQSGGGSFINHTGSGHLYLSSVGNINLQPNGGGVTTGAATSTGMTMTGLALNGGTNMTGNQGNGANVAHATGTFTASNLTKTDAAGNIVDAAISGVFSTSTTNQAVCIKASGPPIQLGTCSTTVGAGGACTCN